jgi:hypothetical protein
LGAAAWASAAATAAMPIATTSTILDRVIFRHTFQSLP